MTTEMAGLIQALDLETPEDIQKFILSTLSWVMFAEMYFMDPDDFEEPLHLEIGQKKAIYALQFGYDIDSVPEGYVVKSPPKVVVMIWPRQTGKTTAVAIAVAAILCLQPGVKIGVMGMSEPSAKNLIDRIRTFLQNSPFASEVKRNLKMEIVMKHGGYVMAHSTSQGIRGQSYHYLLLDEAAQIEDEIIEGAAMDTTRKIGKRVVLLSTPKGYQGLLVRYYMQGLRTRKVICKKCHAVYNQGSFAHAQWDAITMAMGLPPCVECGHQEDDRTWTRAPQDATKRVRELLTITEGQSYFYVMGDYAVISIDPFNCSFYSVDDIIKELDRRGWTPLARQELLGEIIPEGQAVFRRSWIEAGMDDKQQNVMRQPHPDIQYIMGLDFGKIHDDSVLAVGHEDKDGKAVLDYMRIIPADVKGKEYEDIRDEIVEVAMFYHPIWIVPDSTGMGEPIVEQMEKDLFRLGWNGRIYSNKNNRLGFIFDMKSKPDLIENLVNFFSRSRIIMPPEYEPDIDILVNQLLNFAYAATATNYIKYGVQLEHDDAVIALALFVWGLRHKPWISPVAVFAEPRGNL